VTTASLIRVANLDQLHGDGPHALSANGIDVVVVRTAAGLRAFEGHCPHQGALLGEGELDGDKLVCRNHRWRFSTDSGQHEGGPECLAACPVVERERTLFVDISALSRGPGWIVAKRTLDDLPGPRGLPFLGNIHQLDLTKVHLILERWAAQYGPVYLLRMGSKRVVALSDPKWCDRTSSLWRACATCASLESSAALASAAFYCKGPPPAAMSRSCSKAASFCRSALNSAPTLLAWSRSLSGI
jgi:nitrite reductase/ring-hydroxylating ferredoxin subunit